MRSLREQEASVDGTDDKDRRTLLEQRCALLRRLAGLREREARLLAECAGIRKELELGSATYRERRAACDEKRENLTLLRAHRHKIETQTSVCREYARRITRGLEMGNQQQVYSAIGCIRAAFLDVLCSEGAGTASSFA